MADTPPRQVDLLIDLRERLVRIETKYDERASKDTQVDEALTDLRSRMTVQETESTVLRAQLATLKWVGGGLIAFVVFIIELLPRFFGG